MSTHAGVSGGGVGAFGEIHRGAAGDARGSSQNNLAELRPLRPRSRATAATGPAAAAATRPDVQQVCPATFGNSDIYGFSSLP